MRLFLKLLIIILPTISTTTENITESDKYVLKRPNIFLSSNSFKNRIRNSDDHISFSYSGPTGPSFWKLISPACGGMNQSPIDLILNELELASLPELQWSPVYAKVPAKMVAVNNRHTVQIQVNYDNGAYAQIKGGPLKSSYNFQELHFHWGSDDHLGSEHRIDGKTFPLEAHLVHLRSDFKTMKQGLEVPDGVVVIAYLFELTSEENPALHCVMEIAEKLMKNLDEKVSFQNTFALNQLALQFKNDYVTYNGSLTVPPCAAVMWIISPYTLDVSEVQLNALREISRAHTGMTNNFREPQPLNGRKVLFVT